jgi:hypothetical protein
MSQTIEEKNKALVLDSFDTLFNKRDYAAAEKYWSPDYIQHRRGGRLLYCPRTFRRNGQAGCLDRRGHCQDRER